MNRYVPVTRNGLRHPDSIEGLTPVQMQAKQLWQAVLDDMQLRLGKNAFENWICPTSLVGFDDDVATIAAPNTFTATTLESRYAGEIRKVLSEIIGRPVAVEFTVDTGPPPDADRGTGRGIDRRSELAAIVRDATRKNGPLTAFKPKSSVGTRPGPTPSAERTSKQLELGANPAIGLNPRYTFASYVVGKSNMFANAASLAVAEHPGTQYNPLYVYGGVGLGKTHLLHAIGHRVVELHDHLRVVYVSSEKFTNDLINAIRSQRMDDFRHRYRSIDLLMIDDIQFIGGKDSTQEEFFHTFNTLHHGGKQVVMSSDRPPQAIAGLEDRLRSRFEGGLQADVQTPDYEMRMAILRTKAEDLGVTLPDEAVEYIAQRDQTNTRELEGALNRAIALSRVTNRPISMQLVIEALTSGRVGSRREDLTADEVVAKVAEHFGISAELMRSRNRSKDVVLPRQIAMYLQREETSASLAEIGRSLGGRDHTTVIHGIEKIESKMESDPALRAQVMSMREAILSTDQ